VEERRVVKVYSALSRVYDLGFDWALGPGRRQALRRLPFRPSDRVLEVGVGTGLSLPFYPPDCRVTGIDISEAMIEHAHQRARDIGRHDVELRIMDARELAFPEDCFDHVFVPYVVSVVPEPIRVMEETLRVCKPGGTIVVVNHFHGSNGVRRWFERVFSPVTQWIGFRMDLPIETVTEVDGASLETVEPVNLLGMWRLIVMRKSLPKRRATPVAQVEERVVAGQ
jgi:phosphatidylethanolamine/phosphatidyl-N-methylethanolamine N-methyltransferase